MKKRLALVFGLVLFIALLGFVSASQKYYEICFIEGKITQINFQQEYTEYNTTYGCEAFPCRPYNRTTPAKYLLSLNSINAQNTSSYCAGLYNKSIEENISVYKDYLISADKLLIGNSIKGNVTTYPDESYFINDQYEITEPEEQLKITFWEKIMNWFKSLF